MKSIIFCVTNDLSYDQRMHRICSSLTSNGYKVKLLGRKRKKSPPLKLEKWDQKRLNCIFTGSFLFYTEYNIRLFFYLLFHKADILCAIDLDTILPVVLAGKIHRSETLYDAHEYFTEVPELIGRQTVKRIWHFTGKFTVPLTKARYTVSDSLAKELGDIYKYPFDVIRNVPVLSETKSHKPDKKAHCIIYIGAVNKGRGLELLINAMEHINAGLIIAGDGDIFQDIKNLVTYKGLNNKITLTGYVLPGEINNLTESATIGYNLLDPSSKNYYYSLSNKFFTYMHAGVPSISNDFPEYKKINEEYETGILCNFDMACLIKAVSKLISDENFYTRLKNNNIEASKNFQWKNEEIKLLRLYDEL